LLTEPGEAHSGYAELHYSGTSALFHRGPLGTRKLAHTHLCVPDPEHAHALFPAHCPRRPARQHRRPAATSCASLI